MDLTDKIDAIIAFAVGGALGYILGYIVSGLRTVQKEVHEIDTIVKNGQNGSFDERGFVENRRLLTACMLIVVVLSVWAAFSSQKSTNTLEETNQQLTKVTVCNQTYLAETIRALNERTTFSREQATANVELQKAQAEYLNLVLRTPPPNRSEAIDALKNYFDKLTEFVEVNSKAAQKAESYPYPTNEDLYKCLGVKPPEESN